jgi:hypothetical protein
VKALFAAVLGAAVFVAAATAGFAQVSPPVAPPPTPPAPQSTPAALPTSADTGTPLPSGTPTPAPGGRGGRGRRGATPAPAATAIDTPEPPQFQSLDGVWEFVLQPAAGKTAGKVYYSHIAFAQNGDKIVGQWYKEAPGPKAIIPLTGTFDGRIFKFTLTPASGPPQTMAGYVENFGDMVGMYDDGAGNATAFTADHRKKVKFYEQPGIGVPGAPGGGVNGAPGGVGGHP